MLFSTGSSGASTYTFVDYTYVAVNASSLASITSPALTLSAGDFAVVAWRGVITSSPTFSNSCGDTFTELTGTVWVGVAYFQMAYVLSTCSGSITFTVTPTSSTTFQSMTVLHYSHTGAAASFDSQVTDTAGPGANSITSTSFNTSAAGLTIFCSTLDGSVPFSVGNIGGSAGTERGRSAASGNADMMCEDRQFGSAQTGITAAMSDNDPSTYSWGATVGNFK